MLLSTSTKSILGLRNLKFKHFETLGTSLQLQSVRHGSHKRVLRFIPGRQINRTFWKDLKFYFFLGAIPTVSLITYVNLTSGEVILCDYDPNVYQPENHEFYKHPITRFFAKRMQDPVVTHYKDVYRHEQAFHDYKVRKLLKEIKALKMAIDKEPMKAMERWASTQGQDELMQEEIEEYIKKEKLPYRKDLDD